VRENSDQPFEAEYVRSGSLATNPRCPRDVRFTSVTGQTAAPR
jgi:hypothetical protein